MPSKKAVGRALSALLKERGLKQKDLAKLTSLDPSRISRIVRGEVMPTVKTLDRLLIPLGISSGRFLEYSEELTRFQKAQGVAREPKLEGGTAAGDEPVVIVPKADDPTET